MKAVLYGVILLAIVIFIGNSREGFGWYVPRFQPIVVPSAPPAPPAPIPPGCVSGSEGQTVITSCPNNETITGGTIRYGRWDNTAEPKEKTVSIPRTCIGQSSCAVQVNNDSMGGDPYPNIFKQFVICPTCTSPPPPPSAPSPSMASGSNYAASCTKCTLVNNQLSCSCDVTPR
jgi:hypothetical protein